MNVPLQSNTKPKGRRKNLILLDLSECRDLLSDVDYSEIELSDDDFSEDEDENENSSCRPS